MDDKKRNAGKSYLATDPVIRYVNEKSLRLHPTQKQLIELTTTSNVPRPQMLSSAEELQLLQNLCKLIGAKKTLDIGVFTGYSALTIALVLPSDGKVVACDVSEEFANVGKPLWKEAGVADKIDLRIAPATETLQKLIDSGEAGTYDFAFIDADKLNYDTYYEQCLKLLRSGGIIALDNVLCGGQVADPNCTRTEAVSFRNLNDKIHKDERVDMNMLNIADGVTLCFKR